MYTKCFVVARIPCPKEIVDGKIYFSEVKAKERCSELNHRPGYYKIYPGLISVKKDETETIDKVKCPKCRIIMTLIKQAHGTPTHYWKCRKCGGVVCTQ